ncbi:MAG TPA: phosphoglycolate phosphatase [Burkholderiaceae bacterium]|nr:phosphoglycolate phosphatase [Burkholderiaceae bacterium]
MPRPTELVLFDLDGTLVDTAPDLAAAANRLRQRRGLAPLPIEVLRPAASHGARGLVGAALNVTPENADFAACSEEFLVEYAQRVCVESRVFDGIEKLLGALEARGVRWGVVTNKAARFTEPLLNALHLQKRAACVVSGDTTAHLKPHPASLLHALALCQVAAEATLYVGDDERDIHAGHAAGMRTVAARYGYLGSVNPVDRWGADHQVDTPEQILQLLG